jgi:hypothetical protein
MMPQGAGCDRRKTEVMRLWLIPMIYVGASVVCGLALPRIEQAYLSSDTMNLLVASAQACRHRQGFSS